jgi:hypothetical protein
LVDIFKRITQSFTSSPRCFIMKSLSGEGANTINGRVRTVQSWFVFEWCWARRGSGGDQRLIKSIVVSRLAPPSHILILHNRAQA